jgi:hypothetical protein
LRTRLTVEMDTPAALAISDSPDTLPPSSDQVWRKPAVLGKILQRAFARQGRYGLVTVHILT